MKVALIRGAGDIATGVAWRLNRAGFGVVATELVMPLTVRRTVSLSSAVADGVVDVEGLVGRRCEIADALIVAEGGEVAVVVSPELPNIEADVVVDARLAKRNIDTTINDAPLVVGLGPGLTAGLDCHAVIETQRGHRLGRVLWAGSAEPNTGTPGLIEGKGRERVLRATADGVITWDVEIGATVAVGESLGAIGTHQIDAPFDGVLRGAIATGTSVRVGLKVGDVDPRLDPSMCHEISDKALAIGGGVVEAVLFAGR